jgi:hypothetical protein
MTWLLCGADFTPYREAVLLSSSSLFLFVSLELALASQMSKLGGWEEKFARAVALDTG